MSKRAGIVVDDIIRVAAEIADANGLQEVTMANLAKRLRIKSPSLYNHISGLSELFNRLTLLALENFYAQLKEATLGLEKKEAIHALSKSYIEFARNHPGLYELTIKAPNPKQKDIVNMADKIIALIRGILSPFGLAEEKLIHAIRGFRSLLHGFASIELKGGFGLPVDTDKSFIFLVDAFLRGIKE
ncbi:TetR/AcrR family transcriptional regulator [Niallia sp. NCCP-28]|uniref:TetR/AcrR family transcriptional regulator n=1 Tax=Niallia sp. NCCP-28 TaxID=2934712 RepID=UPI00208291EA|nr:TetR/AcrR family transcriptional regulator [Niallia sp. NCCP-28]GKU83550.1 TetR family transcriptional regulator [Niallia sp. NCCP-28]